jgi:hypothetical protein
VWKAGIDVFLQIEVFQQDIELANDDALGCVTIRVGWEE